MNKAQKWTIEICLLLILISILIPPFNQYEGTTTKAVIIKSEWNFIWTTNKSVASFRKIRFDILILEWIAIITIGSIFFIKKKKMEDK